jgi:hypothetical protein
VLHRVNTETDFEYATAVTGQVRGPFALAGLLSRQIISRREPPRITLACFYYRCPRLAYAKRNTAPKVEPIVHEGVRRLLNDNGHRTRPSRLG